MLLGDRADESKMGQGSEPLCRRRTRPYGYEDDIVRYARTFLVEVHTLGHSLKPTHAEEASDLGSSFDLDWKECEGRSSYHGSQVQVMQQEGRGGASKSATG
jgi:hypothetical protein